MILRMCYIDYWNRVDDDYNGYECTIDCLYTVGIDFPLVDYTRNVVFIYTA